MRIKDIIYFSPNLKLEDLKLSNPEHILYYFKERIENYYFEPIEVLNQHKMAFASGSLECLLIDVFARYTTTEDRAGVRIVNWAQTHLQLHNAVADKFYKFFRCGLLHEGHIKQFGQFCFDEGYINSAIMEEQDHIIVNPKYLLEELRQYLERFIELLKEDKEAYSIFINRLEEDFSDEVKKAKTNQSSMCTKE